MTIKVQYRPGYFVTLQIENVNDYGEIRDKAYEQFQDYIVAADVVIAVDNGNYTVI